MNFDMNTNTLINMLKGFIQPTKDSLINDYIKGKITKTQLDKEIKNLEEKL